MKILNGTTWAYTLLGLMTLVYILFLWSGASMMDLLESSSFYSELPGPTRLFVHPDTLIVWILLACASFLGNMVWGLWRARRANLHSPHHLPILCHLIWIVTISFFHQIALWLPVFKMGETV